MNVIRVGMIGHKFMGKAHTHGYTDLPLFFDPGVDVQKRTLCAREASVADTARRWGWQSWTHDWRTVVEDPEIDLVDIAAPSSMHAEVAIAALRAGKHVFCEKPLALTLDDARRMTEEAVRSGKVHMIGFNYRRVPALALARMLVQQGEIGQIRHFRGIYQQGWLVDPGFPLAWRLRKSEAGYGSLGDLGAHVVDLARFLVGDVAEVCCQQRTFVRSRPKPVREDGLVAVAGTEMGTVDVDDASAFLMRFRHTDAAGYIEATRYGCGHRNQNVIEINGSKGSLVFDMEKMNDLELYSEGDPSPTQGFRRIQVGEAAHPYMANWWPAGHVIGYGDTFVNQAYDLVTAIKNGGKATPDFHDGLACQEVLNAAQVSADTHSWQRVEAREQEPS